MVELKSDGNKYQNKVDELAARRILRALTVVQLKEQQEQGKAFKGASG